MRSSRKERRIPAYASPFRDRPVLLPLQAKCLRGLSLGETVWKVKPKNKIFCFGGTPESTKITVRATLDEQAALTQLPGISPAPYLARHGWVMVDLAEPQNLEMVTDLIDRSYDLVMGRSKSG